MAFELTPTIRFWLNFAHPAIMWVLLALSLYAAYLGLQVQRTRNAQGEEKKELIKGRFTIKHPPNWFYYVSCNGSRFNRWYGCHLH